MPAMNRTKSLVLMTLLDCALALVDRCRTRTTRKPNKRSTR